MYTGDTIVIHPVETWELVSPYVWSDDRVVNSRGGWYRVGDAVAAAAFVARAIEFSREIGRAPARVERPFEVMWPYTGGCVPCLRLIPKGSWDRFHLLQLEPLWDAAWQEIQAALA